MAIRSGKQKEVKLLTAYSRASEIVEQFKAIARPIYAVTENRSNLAQTYGPMRAAMYDMYQGCLEKETSLFAGQYQEVAENSTVMSNIFNKIFPA